MVSVALGVSFNATATWPSIMTLLVDRSEASLRGRITIVNKVFNLRMLQQGNLKILPIGSINSEQPFRYAGN